MKIATMSAANNEMLLNRFVTPSVARGQEPFIETGTQIPTVGRNLVLKGMFLYSYHPNRNR